MRPSYKQKEQEIGKQRKTVNIENPDQKWGDVEENPEQESLTFNRSDKRQSHWRKSGA